MYYTPENLLFTPFLSVRLFNFSLKRCVSVTVFLVNTALPMYIATLQYHLTCANSRRLSFREILRFLVFHKL